MFRFAARRVAGVRVPQPYHATQNLKLAGGNRTFSASAISKEAMDLAGKTAIITGAGSGIGLSFASILLKKNCNVVIADLALTPQAESLVATPHTSGAKAVFCPTDVTSFSQLAALFPFTRNAGLGDADIVVPGAGVYEPDWSSFFSGDTVGAPDSRYRSLDINLVHPIHLTRLAISEFLRAGKKQGAVIHVSSVAAQNPWFSTPLYNASKAGLSHFVRSFAQLEEQLGIRVSAVAPGVIKTPLWTEHPEKLRLMDPAKDEFATPEEVAIAMMMLLECTDLPGGTVLEVAKGTRRIVQVKNDPGPSGPATVTSNTQILVDEIMEKLKKERSAATA